MEGAWVEAGVLLPFEMAPKSASSPGSSSLCRRSLSSCLTWCVGAGGWGLGGGSGCDSMCIRFFGGAPSFFQSRTRMEGWSR